MLASCSPNGSYQCGCVLWVLCWARRCVWEAGLWQPSRDLSQVPQSLLQCGRPGFDPWVGKVPWRRERLPTPVFCPGEFHGYSPYIGKSWTQLSNFHFQSLQSRLLCEELITHVDRTICPLQEHAGNTSTSWTYCSHFCLQGVSTGPGLQQSPKKVLGTTQELWTGRLQASSYRLHLCLTLVYHPSSPLLASLSSPVKKIEAVGF